MNLDVFLIIMSFLAGLAATAVMTVIELPAWKRWGLRGVLEWHENQNLSKKFFRLSGEELHWKGIFALHFGNGGLGGVGFVLALVLFSFASQNLLLSGILYAIFLWVVTLIPIHKPITGITPWKHPDGNMPMLISLAGHLVYGVVLQYIIGLLL